jgi:hypothetical protein
MTTAVSSWGFKLKRGGIFHVKTLDCPGWIACHVEGLIPRNRQDLRVQTIIKSNSNDVVWNLDGSDNFFGGLGMLAISLSSPGL